MKSFKGKIVLITGAASGICLSLSTRLVDLGAIVISADIKNSNQGDLSRSQQLSKVHLDVTKEHQFKSLILNVVSTYGRLDILINGAGYNVRGEALDIAKLDSGLDDFDMSLWNRIFSVNYFGAAQGSLLALAQMRKQGSGQIINIASLAGLTSYSTNAPYGAAKAAIINHTAALRAEACDYGVDVKVICPGYIDTNFLNSKTMYNGKLCDLKEELVFKPVDVDKTADMILKKLQGNASLINVPRYPRLTWLYAFNWITRLMLDPMQKQVIRKFRSTPLSSILPN